MQFAGTPARRPYETVIQTAKRCNCVDKEQFSKRCCKPNDNWELYKEHCCIRLASSHENELQRPWLEIASSNKCRLHNHILQQSQEQCNSPNIAKSGIYTCTASFASLLALRYTVPGPSVTKMEGSLREMACAAAHKWHAPKLH